MRFNLSVMDHGRTLPKLLSARNVARPYLSRASRVGGPQAIVREDLNGTSFRSTEQGGTLAHVITIPNLNLKVTVVSTGAADRSVLRSQSPQLTILNTELYLHYNLDEVEVAPDVDFDDDIEEEFRI